MSGSRGAAVGGGQPPRLGWLAAGAAIGLVAAAFGLLQRSPAGVPLPPDAVARVDGAIIERADFERAVERMTGQPYADAPADVRAWVLDTLVEQELLVQRGRELGLAESDPAVRNAIIQSMIASVTAAADAADPDDAELQAFLEAHADDYTYASALAVDAWVTDDESAARNFVSALAEGRTNPPEGLRRVPGLPDAALPVERLRMFLGPAITAAAGDMPAGASAIYARQGRWYVVRVNRHADAALADLAAIRSQVLVDYRRALADRMLEDYVARLLEDAAVQVAPP